MVQGMGFSVILPSLYPLLTLVFSGTLSHFSGPWFPHPQNGGNNSRFFVGLRERFYGLICEKC